MNWSDFLEGLERLLIRLSEVVSLALLLIALPIMLAFSLFSVLSDHALAAWRKLREWQIETGMARSSKRLDHPGHATAKESVPSPRAHEDRSKSPWTGESEFGD